MGVMKKAFCVWVAMYVYGCTPHRWTSWERVWKETAYRMFYPIVCAQWFNKFGTVDGTLPRLDAFKLLPVEAPPNYLIIGGDNWERNIATVKAAYEKEDAIVVWKNFTNGMMDHWLSESYAKETLDLDKTYDFLQGFSNMNASTFTMREAFDVGLENLYMGFNYHILNDNEETLHADLMKTIAQYGEDFVKMIGADTALHHAFVYKGMAYRTGVHQAPASDWFFQIGNGKVWRFVEPKYTPYLRPHSPDGISTMSAYDYFPDDFGVPYVDVDTDAGDMMFFPPHWWHQVKNKDPEAFGMGFGFRPTNDAKFAALSAILFPVTAKTGIVSHRIAMLAGIFYSKIKQRITARIQGTVQGNSGVQNRMDKFSSYTESFAGHVPSWSWDNHPELRAAQMLAGTRTPMASEL